MGEGEKVMEGMDWKGVVDTVERLGEEKATMGRDRVLG